MHENEILVESPFRRVPVLEPVWLKIDFLGGIQNWFPKRDSILEGLRSKRIPQTTVDGHIKHDSTQLHLKKDLNACFALSPVEESGSAVL